MKSRFCTDLTMADITQGTRLTACDDRGGWGSAVVVHQDPSSKHMLIRWTHSMLRNTVDRIPYGQGLRVTTKMSPREAKDTTDRIQAIKVKAGHKPAKPAKAGRKPAKPTASMGPPSPEVTERIVNDRKRKATDDQLAIVDTINQQNAEIKEVTRRQRVLIVAMEAQLRHATLQHKVQEQNFYETSRSAQSFVGRIDQALRGAEEMVKSMLKEKIQQVFGLAAKPSEPTKPTRPKRHKA